MKGWVWVSVTGRAPRDLCDLARGSVVRGVQPHNFFCANRQNLGSKGVAGGISGRSGQNLETKGLRGKILKNKDLGEDFKGLTPSGKVDSLEAANCIFLIVFLSDFSVKVVRHI